MTYWKKKKRKKRREKEEEEKEKGSLWRSTLKVNLLLFAKVYPVLPPSLFEHDYRFHKNAVPLNQCL